MIRRRLLSGGIAATGAVGLWLAGCNDTLTQPPGGAGGLTSSGAAPAGGHSTGGGGLSSSGGGLTGSGGTAGGSSGGSEAAGPVLQTAPLIFSPTLSGFGVNVVLGAGAPAELALQYRKQGELEWSDADPASSPAADVAEWTLAGLLPGTRYDYRVFTLSDATYGTAGAASLAGEPLYQGQAVTQRLPGDAFRFVLLTDTHISPRDFPPRSTLSGEYQEDVLLQLAPMMQAEQPDFMINLGDMLDFHDFGFNLPPPNGEVTRLAYLNYRRCLMDALGNAAHFPIIGNWEGENGSYSPEQIGYSQAARMRYVPGPTPDTYPEGGSPTEDYYAFTWGDALFVALNVMTYTPKELLLDGIYGSPEDWTLGEAQLAWLESTLAQSSSRWKFLLIHHAVGGAGGDLANAIYGRGGGLAAQVGQQARVHELMLEHGVQVFFYGHDHVFTDIVVDGIHYTLPGSAGAPWKFDQTETGYETQWTDSGYATVEVGPTEAKVDFLSINNETLLSYQLQQPDAP